MATRRRNGHDIKELHILPWNIPRWRHSRAYLEMSLAAQGAYRNLCDAAWMAQPTCTLPNDDRHLWRLAGARTMEEWLILKSDVFACSDGWALTESGEWSHDVVMSEFQSSMERSNRRSAAGAIGGKASGRVRKPANDRSTIVQRSSNGRSTIVKHRIGGDRRGEETEIQGEIAVKAETEFSEKQQLLAPCVAAVEAPKDIPSDAERITSLYFANFNAVFGRRVRYTGKHVERVRARLKDKFKPWHIVALPILVDAQGLPDDMRRTMDPSVPLRDGRHARTTSGGTTAGATDWLERALGRIDRTRLTAAHEKIAAESGVLAQLLESGVTTSTSEAR